ncbi:MAG: HAD hydrolase-like protein [Patescibacteria group bacterium]|nr:HAD hydrolase-like protein [Patescibacteria group bacterium]
MVFKKNQVSTQSKICYNGTTMKKIILFDFDGVIVDSFETAYSIVEELQLGFSRQYYREMFCGNIFDSVDSHHQNGNHKKVSQEEWFKLYAKKLLKLPVIIGMPAALKKLSASYRLVVVSSSINSPIQSYLELHHINQLFDKVYGADVHRSKIEKMRMVLAEYNISQSDCVFVTDTAGDLKEAAKVGIDSIVVSWGFHSKDYFSDLNYYQIVERPNDLVRVVNEYFAE